VHPTNSPRQRLAGELIEIILPIGVAVAAELEQIVPAVDAGRVQVVEDEPHRVIAEFNRPRLYCIDGYENRGWRDE